MINLGCAAIPRTKHVRRSSPCTPMAQQVRTYHDLHDDEFL